MDRNRHRHPGQGPQSKRDFGITPLVGVEGHSTAGKSTLATDLGHRLDGRVFSTDGYVEATREVETYVEMLRLDELARDLAAAPDSFVVVEGICLRPTLRATPCGRARLFVYCKRITQAGLWADELENYFEDGNPASWLSWVDRQSVIYHTEERPDEKADVVFLRKGGI